MLLIKLEVTDINVDGAIMRKHYIGDECYGSEFGWKYKWKKL